MANNYTTYIHKPSSALDFFNNFEISKYSPGVYKFIDDTEQEVWSKNKDQSKKHGWTSDNITYTINQYGYRGKEPGGDAGFGCSYSFGYGVDDVHTWPYLLDVFNGALPGSSNDRIARLAVQYMNTFKPKNIYIVWSFISRREHVDEAGNFYQFTSLSEAELNEHGNEYKLAMLELANKNSNMLNLQKNQILVEHVAKSLGVRYNYKVLQQTNYTNYLTSRDLDHPNPQWHRIIAEDFKE